MNVMSMYVNDNRATGANLPSKKREKNLGGYISDYSGTLKNLEVKSVMYPKLRVNVKLIQTERRQVQPVASPYNEIPFYQPRIYAKTRGATIVASLSITYLGVLISSLPQVIFSFGTAPE